MSAWRRGVGLTLVYRYRFEEIAKIMPALAIALSTLAFGLICAVPSQIIFSHASLILQSLAFIFVTAFSFRAAIVLVILGISGSAMLDFVNQTKLDLTKFPLTSWDISIALENPKGFFDALAISTHLGYAALVLFVLGTVLLVVYGMRQLSIRSISQKLIVLSVVLAGFYAVSERLNEAFQHYEEKNDGLWAPNGVVELSNHLGVPAFLLFTATIQLHESAPLDLEAVQWEVSKGSNYSGSAAWITPLNPSTKPNIVFVLLESAMDLGRSFDIEPKFKSFLVDGDSRTLLSGSLVVNAIGAGTWLTEFETITGLDWRWFGYQGYYSHVSIAPYMRGSVATYFKQFGYTTAAYYPHEGEFYGAKDAYKKYGFDSFYDATFFGIENAWSFPDESFAEYVAADFEGKSLSHPMYSYVLTIENHAPHRCNPDTPNHYRYVNEHQHELNCQLNEYIKRFRSTERAVQIIEEKLQELQISTGRPYLLVLFGDHQPHTFVGSGGKALSPHSYEHLHKQPLNRTFYQIRGSVDRVPFNKRDADLTATLLPTLISAFVAGESDRLYMKENLAVLDECGQSAAGSALEGLRTYKASRTTGRVLSSGCADAQRATMKAAKDRLFR